MRHGRLVDESPHVGLVQQPGRRQLRLDLRQARQEATDARLALDRAVGALVANLPHSLLGPSSSHDLSAVRVVRDPRDVWISSYLYHRRTNEG